MADVATAHPFISLKADGADTTRVRPTNWNANHAYAGGADGDVGAGTDDLMSYTLPAATLGTDGQVLRVTVWGITAGNANAKTIVFNFGATTGTINAVTAAPNAQDWRAGVEIVRA